MSQLIEINGRYYQEAEVVMIATDKRTRIDKIRNSLRYSIYLIPSNAFSEFQHLYILSDEEIKEGWKGIAYKDDIKGKVFNHFYTENKWYKDAKIIIASTDESLGLPRPSNEFIKRYCELGGIDEVLVEYKCSYEDCNMFGCHKYEGCHLIQQLKVVPDNTITIYPI